MCYNTFSLKTWYAFLLEVGSNIKISFLGIQDQKGIKMIKIVADKQSKLYELTYLLPADFTDSQLATAGESILKLITKHKGKVLQTQDWGKKSLAYKIRHQGKFHTEAAYTHQVVKFPPTKVQAFEKEVLLEEQVMRHLVVVSENQSEKSVEEVGKKD